MRAQNPKKLSGANAADTEASESKGEKRSRRSTSVRQGKTTSNRGWSEPRPPKVRPPNLFPIVGIGASAGGLEAFTKLLNHLPTDTGMGFVLVQHLDPVHESALTDILARATKMPVREVTNNLPVKPNCVYIIPPNANMIILYGILRLQPRQNHGGQRSIDTFLESLAHDRGTQAIGVILSGTATDGTLGLEAIKAEGGITFAQDESAKYDSMPRSANAAGCVDLVLSPENIAKELARVAKHPHLAGALNDSAERPSPEEQDAKKKELGRETPLLPHAEGEEATSPDRGRKSAHSDKDNPFKKIMLLLRNHSGVDFSVYKSTTIQRRITRRMALNKKTSLGSYADFLRGNAKELDALYSDLLIGVTSFFRNPEAFKILRRKVLPKLMQRRRAEPLRVWVLGCSTGQEAYSMAMTFVEFLDDVPQAPKLQLFATDLNEALLDKARAGLYSKSLVQDVSPERLRRFFVEEEAGYRINKTLREICVFARQNLLSDPPFSRMDLISCRNVLIYLEPSAQKKIIPTFHYALKPDRFLFLGGSESIGSFADLFEPVDKKQKIYLKKPAATSAPHLPITPTHPGGKKEIPAAKPESPQEGFHAELSAQREADRLTLNRYAPAGALINAELQALQFRGVTDPYLMPPTGKASFNILKMAREGLMLPLRAAINKAKKENKSVRRENVRINQNGSARMIHFEVIPLKNLKDRCYLIQFEEAKAPQEGGARPGAPPAALPSPLPRDKVAAKGESTALRHRIADLESELSETRDYLQGVQDQHESANEELQASNEEVTSANEELQSLNEELETSKEELESANEELTTVNDEMTNRNAELRRLNSDMSNLQTSVNLPVLVLARNLTIRRFTPSAERIFNLLATDVGRATSGIRHNLDFPNLEALVTEVIHKVSVQERVVRDNEGRWYSLRVRPYMTLDNKVDGAVLVLIDISALKQSEREIAAARDYAEATVRTAHDPLIVLRADLCVNTANEAFYKMFKTTPDQTEGRLIFELSGGAWQIPQLRRFLEDILPRNSFFNDFEVTHDFPHIGRRTMLLNARRLNQEDGSSQMILLAIEDMTERMRLDERVRVSEIRYRRLFEAAHDGVLILDSVSRKVTDANPFMTELLGYTRQELLGKELWEIGLLKDEQASHAAFGELQQSGLIRYEDLPLQTKSGEKREVEVVANLYEEDGKQVLQCNIRDITERKRVEAALRASEERLARELTATQQLQSASAMLIEGGNSGALYQKIVEAAASIMRSEMASLQILDESQDALRMLAWRGFDPAFGKIFEFNRSDTKTSCSVARRAGHRVIVPDVEICDFIVGTTALEDHRKMGIAAVQSTPLFSRGGRLLGMISTHWRTPHTPTEIDLRQFDILARQAADLLERMQAEEAVRLRTVQFETLLNEAPLGVYLVDGDFRIRQVNPTALSVFGNIPDLIGRDFDDVIHILWTKAYADEIVERFRHTLETGEPYETPERIERRIDRGVTEYYEWRINRIPLPEGGYGVTCYFRDISHQVLTRAVIAESEERFRTLVSVITDVPWITDGEGQFTTPQPAWAAYTGQTWETHRGFGWANALHPEDRAQIQATWERACKSQTLYQSHGRVWHAPTQQYRYFEARATPLLNADGSVREWVGTCTDIQNQKEVEEVLKQKTTEAEEANRMKSQFVSYVSHDLRTPLNAIIGYTQLLLGEKYGLVAEDQKKPLDGVKRNADTLLKLINDVLDLSKIESGKASVDLTAIDFSSLTKELLDQMKPLLDEKSLTIQRRVAKKLPMIESDAMKVRQILTNLLSNAIKFTDRGRITIEMKDLPERAGIEIAVQDTGIGIKPEELSRIFESFYQVDQARESGTGLGLKIVKDLVHLLKGEIDVQSEYGRGSTFTLFLPYHQSEGKVDGQA